MAAPVRFSFFAHFQLFVGLVVITDGASAEVQADFRIMVLEASNVPKESGAPN